MYLIGEEILSRNMKNKGSALLCLLGQLSLLFLTDALETNGNLKITKRSPNWNEPHTFEKSEGCTRDFMKGFNKVVAGSACKPRPVVVDIIPPSSEIQFIPNKVLVNRCSGMCHAKLLCTPTETEKVPIQVQQLNFLDHEVQPECGVVHVEEHKKCNCMCTVTKEDCNDKQVYQSGECNCSCINEEEKSSCLSKGRTWDNGPCTCQ